MHEGVRWVDGGRIVTSSGIPAGINMSLHLGARLDGDALALRTTRQIGFGWTRTKRPGRFSAWIPICT